jgi:hypothetical protein
MRHTFDISFLISSKTGVGYKCVGLSKTCNIFSGAECFLSIERIKE